MASEHAIYYMKTLFQWMTYITLIGCHTHKGLIAKLINDAKNRLLATQSSRALDKTCKIEIKKTLQKVLVWYWPNTLQRLS